MAADWNIKSTREFVADHLEDNAFENYFSSAF
jgi:hypothetical protein